MNPGIQCFKRNTCYVAFCPNVFYECFVSIIHETFFLEFILKNRYLVHLANLGNDDARNFISFGLSGFI